MSDEKDPVITGLAPGPEHDHVVAAGNAYFVYALEPGNDYPEGPYAVPWPGHNVVGFLLEARPWLDWCRVTATSPGEAMRLYEDAHDQHRAWLNGHPDWQNVASHASDSKERERLVFMQYRNQN